MLERNLLHEMRYYDSNDVSKTTHGSLVCHSNQATIYHLVLILVNTLQGQLCLAIEGINSSAEVGLFTL